MIGGRTAAGRFLSTPSARRATSGGGSPQQRMRISIHALREEGDVRRSIQTRINADFYPRPPRGGRRQCKPPAGRGAAISIHALREEGDKYSG